MFWLTTRTRSRRKARPELEPLDTRAVPATFGGFAFIGPATVESGPLAFSTPAARAFASANATLTNRYSALLANQITQFGATPFVNRPFFTFNNTANQVFTRANLFNNTANRVFTRANLFNNTANQVFTRANLFNNAANRVFAQADANLLNRSRAQALTQNSRFSLGLAPFVNRPFSAFNNVNVGFNPFNAEAATGRPVSQFSSVIPTNPTYPLGSNGFFSIINTPSGPAGLL